MTILQQMHAAAWSGTYHPGAASRMPRSAMRQSMQRCNRRFNSQSQVAMRESVELNYDIAGPNWEDYRPSDTSIPIVEELPAPAGLFQAAAPSALPGCGASSGVGGVGSLFESLPLPDGASATQALPPATEPSTSAARDPPSDEALPIPMALLPWEVVGIDTPLEASPPAPARNRFWRPTPAETSDAEVLYMKDADDDASSDEVVMF